jgi:hypothetical protein
LNHFTVPVATPLPPRLNAENELGSGLESSHLRGSFTDRGGSAAKG